jgi:hypothetical protein
MSDRFQQKLAHYEVAPPPGTWSAIVDALEDQSSAVSSKLQNLEEPPPARLWQHIEDELDTDRDIQPQNIPLHKRFAKPLRYGSAVAILVLVAVTITLLLQKDTQSDQLAQQPTLSLPARDKAASTTESGTVSEDSQQQPVQSVDNTEPEAQTDESPLSADNPPTEKTTHRPNDHRYLTVATETGTPVRFSKKIYPVFDCAEHSTDQKRHQCKKNIEYMQKMASSMSYPSGDFASLIDMIKTLEENR